MRKNLAAAAAATLSLLSLAAPSFADPAYTVSDLGNLGGTSGSWGTAINASGEVTGYSYAAGNQGPEAFLYNGSTMGNLGTLGGEYSYGFGINASGEVTGFSPTTGNSASYAFLYNGSTMENLGALSGDISLGFGINDNGEVTGWSQTSGGVPLAFLYDDGTMTLVGTPGPSLVPLAGYAIDDAGEVTGYAEVLSNGTYYDHAFLYNGSASIDLGTLGGSASMGYALNASGEVAGWSTTATGAYNAFLYDDGAMTDLGTLPGYQASCAYGVNDNGEVVGYVSGNTGCATPGANTGGLAFLYDDGTMYNLNDLISASDPLYGDVDFGDATAVNDSGQIVANGCYVSGPSEGVCDAFLLDPVLPTAAPEPASLALYASALAGLGAARRRMRSARS